MKHLFCIFAGIFAVLCAVAHAGAAPYGPTLNDVAHKYAATKTFAKLNESLSRELIDIRLGMSMEDVEEWAARSRVYVITSRKGSIFKFEAKDFEISWLSFEVWFAKGQVVVIKTFNINDFEAEESELKELKALRPVRTNECWVRQNYVDPDSYANGYDFALMTERGIPLNAGAACMGSDRANITIGKPGTLYPKHIRK